MSQIVFQTDQSGANQNICSTAVASTVTFNFSVSANYEAYSANITMKKASGTTDPVTITIYDQPNGGGAAVGSSTVLASAVTQSFEPIEFLFSGLTLTAGTSYSLRLSSPSSCAGSSPYSFKSGNFQVTDRLTSAVINTGYAIASNITSVATATASPKASLKTNSQMGSTVVLSSGTMLDRGVSSAIVSDPSVSASMNIVADAKAAIETGSSLSADLSGAKSLFSVFADLVVFSEVSAAASLVAGVASEMNSSCLLGASAETAGENGRRAREGSGHHVLNSGAFTLRKWRRFIKVSDDNTPKIKHEGKEIDLRTPGLLRRPI